MPRHAAVSPKCIANNAAEERGPARTPWSLPVSHSAAFTRSGRDRQASFCFHTIVDERAGRAAEQLQGGLELPRLQGKNVSDDRSNGSIERPQAARRLLLNPKRSRDGTCRAGSEGGGDDCASLWTGFLVNLASKFPSGIAPPGLRIVSTSIQVLFDLGGLGAANSCRCARHATDAALFTIVDAPSKGRRSKCKHLGSRDNLAQAHRMPCLGGGKALAGANH